MPIDKNIKRPCVVCRNHNRNSPAVASSSGELFAKKAVKSNQVKRCWVICRYCNLSPSTAEAPNGQLRAEKTQIVIVVCCYLKPSGKNYVTQYFQALYWAKKWSHEGKVTVHGVGYPKESDMLKSDIRGSTVLYFQKIYNFTLSLVDSLSNFLRCTLGLVLLSSHKS